MKLVLTAKHVSATNTRGSRVKITWPARNKSISFDWLYELNGADEQAKHRLQSLSLEFELGDAGKDGYFLVADWPIGDDAKCDAIRSFFGVK